MFTWSSFILLFPSTPLPVAPMVVKAARPLQTISPRGTLYSDIGTTLLVRRSARNMCSDRPKNIMEHITKRGRVRALEDTSAHSTARQVPLISPMGYVHIPIEDPYERITDEQIMEITIQCGITLGWSRIRVTDRLRRNGSGQSCDRQQWCCCLIIVSYFWMLLCTLDVLVRCYSRLC